MPRKTARIKVWHVANTFDYAGTERAMALWCRHLDPRVFEVSAFARLRGGPRRQELKKAGIKAVLLEQGLKDWERHLKAGRPDLVHVHRHGEADAGWSALCLAARKAGVRVIVETNVFGVRRRSEGPASPDVMGFVSAFCLWRYLKWPRILPEGALGPLGVFYNPLELDAFPKRGFSPRQKKAARKALGLPADAFIVGRLGRPDIHKWPDWYLGAVKAASRMAPRLRLALMQAPAGVAAKAGRLGLTCHFLEASPLHADILRFYAAVDVLAHASRVGESFGYTLAEAMACGVPVLVDSTPWADNAQVELVEHRVQGLVAARPAAYARALAALARDPALLKRLGASALNRASSFDAAALTRSLEGVYARALQQSGMEHPSFARLSLRPATPFDSFVYGFGAAYQLRLKQVFEARPALDGAWAAFSAVRLYGRGWASRTFKFWRWGR
jgi:glycosyltransferase involved in cell wall biosynthesis